MLFFPYIDHFTSSQIRLATPLGMPTLKLEAADLN